MIAAIVLAAGQGARFGGAKVLARVRGVELVRHVVDRLRMGGAELVVVAAGEAEFAIREVLQTSGAQVVRVDQPGDGMSASLRTAIQALPEECDGFFVALGDQPFIEPETMRRLQDVWSTSNAAAVVPVYRGVRGHPVLFDATLRRRLSALSGDSGARELLVSMGDRVATVDVDQPMPLDVDTPEDLDRLGSA
jgi:molybdenum cofactor cytidylyltransferase